MTHVTHVARPTQTLVKRCLLFGATGFLGSSVRRDLWSDETLELKTIESESVDLSQPLQVKEAIAEIKPDVIVNFAGISAPSSEDFLNIYHVNAFGHLYILQAADALERKPMVFLASSAQLYGPGVMSKATEQTPLNPVSHYGFSKLLAEKYSGLFANVRTVIARLYNVVGRSQSHQFLFPKVVQAFRYRAPRLEIGSLDVERDYIDSRDLSAMLRAVILAQKPPAVVNFSNGETASLRQIISRLEAISGHRLDVVSKAEHFRKNDISFQCGDDSVIRSLGYVRRYSLDDTLTWMLSDQS